MKCIGPDDLRNYLAHDRVGRLLTQATADDQQLVVHRWLAETPAKRMLFDMLYRELLNSPADDLRVLDVGGGVSGLTRLLARSRYTLLDVMAHGGDEWIAALEQEVGQRILFKQDWLTHAQESDATWDVVVANDLFPNVDQRLRLFIQTMLPRCRQLRLSLTCYTDDRYYACRRLDGDEVFFMLAWDTRQTGSILRQFESALIDADFTQFEAPPPSLFANGRHVCVVTLRGGLQ
jgi:hypothetical protein